MNSKKSVYKYFFIFTIIILYTMPCTLAAKIFIVTEIVSGQVVSISEDNSIELDNGFVYHPAKNNIKLLIKPEKYISLRYYIDNNNERQYIDYAPGKNSLKAVKKPKTIKPKHKL